MKVNKLLFLGLLILANNALFAKTFPIKKWQTHNGAQVVFYPANEVPMLDVSVAFAAGSAYDDDSFGLSALTARLINDGSNGMDASTIAQKLADTGAQYQVTNNRDMAVFNLKTLSEKTALNKAVEIFSIMISKPDFPTESFNREKNQQLIRISQRDEAPDQMAEQVFYKALYQKHPYAHSINGEKETVSKISNEEVRDFYKQFYVSKNAIIVLVGAIDEDQAHQIAEKITKDLPPGAHASSIGPADPLAEEMNIEIQFPSSQTVIRMGQIGISHQNKNYFPLVVGNYTLGGGVLVSRLSEEVREKRGLTYGVYSQFLPMPGLGPFIISLSTKNQQAQTAIEVTRKTLTSFLKSGPTDKELEAAKKYITGSFPLSLASNQSIAELLLRITFYNLPEDYLDTYIENVNKVTTDQIKHAFQELINPDKFLQVTVGQM
ncbi:zinc protease (peptidase, M16 family) (plasmid) [Legionella adelaidensis]|uniref:Zinc protease (Peptidase, M16 family) n=1 Tax=Legionella adelaidensis TaxID=45056 RepID=A0A0W0R0E4_9GAMM|nr:pitrilysin family protein [Legionella adelaidensis]KTC64506.1 zinc protease (peptidase, M16 family) [Legionella adelaidensis]VEH85874.1 zinc protease (peptidase, M16 family) [Legionella adelaidensis]